MPGPVKGPGGAVRVLAVAALTVMAAAALPSRAYAACTISTTPVSFGDYSVFSAAPDDSTGTITFRCGSQDYFISVTLSPGGSGSYATRQMRLAAGADRLNYNIYTSASRTTIFGDGTGGTTYYFNWNPPNNRNVTITLYGRISPGQDVGVGNYSDTLIATVNF